jgi:hypothetical protein
MAQIDTSSPFISYHLTDDELITGALLNDLNIYVIQNRVALLSEQLMALEIDTANVLETVKQRSKLDGQISELRFLLETSKEVAQARQDQLSPPATF